MNTFKYLLFTLFILSNITIAQETFTPLFKIYENGLYGYIDSTGKVVIPPKYKSAGEFSEGLAPVRENGYYGYIDETGNYVLPQVYDYAESFNEGFAKIYLEGAPNYINKYGRLMISFDCSQIFPFKSGYSTVYTKIVNGSRKAGVVNSEGVLVIDTIYSEISEFSNGLFIAQNPYQNYVVIDSTGCIIVEAGEYNNISSFHNGFAKVSFYPDKELSSGLRFQGFINVYGELVLILDDTYYYEINDVVSSDSLFIAEAFEYEKLSKAIRMGNRIKGGLMNLKGEWVCSDSINNKFTYMDNEIFTMDTNGLYSFVDSNGKQIGDKFFYYHNGNKTYYSFIGEKNPKKERLFGLADVNFKFIIDPFFELVHPSGIYNEVFIYGKYLTDEKGNYIPAGNDANISKGGICRTNGQIVTPPIFEETDERGFMNGLLLAVKEGRVCYVNMEGEIVWEQKSKTINSVEKDIDYQLTPRHTNGYRRTGTGGNTEKLTEVDFDDNELTIILEKNEPSSGTANINIYLINALENNIQVPAVDGSLYLVLQAKDKNGEWKNIESYPSSSCGMSYGNTSLHAKYFYKYPAELYKGEFKTKIRAALITANEFKNPKMIYSNSIDGSVNPAQFWRSFIWGYYETDFLKRY